MLYDLLGAAVLAQQIVSCSDKVQIGFHGYMPAHVCSFSSFHARHRASLALEMSADICTGAPYAEAMTFVIKTIV